MIALAVIPAGRRLRGRGGVDGDEDKILAGVSVAGVGEACDCKRETLSAVGGTEDSEDSTRGSCWAVGDWCSRTSEFCSLGDLSDLVMENWAAAPGGGEGGKSALRSRVSRLDRPKGAKISAVC